MAYAFFDSNYAPCAFLIVPRDANPYNERVTYLVQTDWDYPGVASLMGWAPCSECDETDGTVDCSHRSASEMISEAYQWIWDHSGIEFPDLDEYLPVTDLPESDPFILCRSVGGGYHVS